MSQAMNPTNQNSPTQPGMPASPLVNANHPEQAGYVPALDERPGLVTFAAVMLFLLAGFQIVFALVEFSNAVWVSGTVYGDFSGRLWLWGIVDALFAVLAFYAAFDLLRGGSFGRIVGIVIAGVSAIRWFFYIPAEPSVAIVMIAVDVLIMYGLVAHSAYFDNAQLQ